MSDRGIIFGAIGATVLIVVGGVWFSSRSGSVSDVSMTGDAVVQVATTTHDWGEISMDGGKVEKVFDIKNEGLGTLKLYGINTSCMCTTARLVMGQEESPEFGMHGKSSYVLEVPKGETAQLKVVFDPAYHGPSGVGPVDRRVIVETNDPNKQRLSFTLTALVRR